MPGWSIATLAESSTIGPRETWIAIYFWLFQPVLTLAAPSPTAQSPTGTCQQRPPTPTRTHLTSARLIDRDPRRRLGASGRQAWRSYSFFQYDANAAAFSTTAVLVRARSPTSHPAQSRSAGCSSRGRSLRGRPLQDRTQHPTPELNAPPSSSGRLQQAPHRADAKPPPDGLSHRRPRHRHPRLLLATTRRRYATCGQRH